jgi:hypothetical protein
MARLAFSVSILKHPDAIHRELFDLALGNSRFQLDPFGNFRLSEQSVAALHAPLSLYPHPM